MDDDKSALLGSLKIDRGPVVERRPPWFALVVIAIVLLLLAGFLLSRGDKAVPVHSVTARLASASDTASPTSVLDASGYVVARRQATVSSKVTGKVVDLSIEEGMHVDEGQVLARIDDSNLRAQLELAKAQLEAQRSTLAEMEVGLADMQKTLKRTKELAGRQLVSQSALDTAQANTDEMRARIDSSRKNVTVAEKTVAVQQQQVDDTIVRAPFPGVITEKNAQPGEMISPLSAGGAGTRTGIGTLVDMGSLEIEVDVNEAFINRVQPAQPCESVLNAYPDWKIPSEVIAVIPTADRSKATVKVRIRLKVQDPRVLPEMGARVSFLPPVVEKPAAAATTPGAPTRPLVLVPTEAIKDEGTTSVVFLVHGTSVERRAVTVAGQRGADTEVSAGLQGGEELAAGDLSKLDDGTTIKLSEDAGK